MECLCQRWSATWFPKCHTPAHNQANGLKTCHEIRVVFKWEPSWEDNARDQTPLRFIILLDMVKYHDLVELKVASTPSKPPNYLFSLSPPDKNRNWTNLCEIMWCASPTTLTESKFPSPPFQLLNFLRLRGCLLDETESNFWWQRGITTWQLHHLQLWPWRCHCDGRCGQGCSTTSIGIRCGSTRWVGGIAGSVGIVGVGCTTAHHLTLEWQSFHIWRFFYDLDYYKTNKIWNVVSSSWAK